MGGATDSLLLKNERCAHQLSVLAWQPLRIWALLIRTALPAVEDVDQKP